MRVSLTFRPDGMDKFIMIIMSRSDVPFGDTFLGVTRSGACGDRASRRAERLAGCKISGICI